MNDVLNRNGEHSTFYSPGVYMLFGMAVIVFVLGALLRNTNVVGISSFISAMALANIIVELYTKIKHFKSYIRPA